MVEFLHPSASGQSETLPSVSSGSCWQPMLRLQTGRVSEALLAAGHHPPHVMLKGSNWGVE